MNRGKINLAGFPSIYCPTLENRKDRAEFMLSQKERYDLNLYLHTVKDFYTHRNEYRVYGQHINETNIINKLYNFSTVISYLECMEIWYENTEEECMLVGDDDTDFSTAEYWNFTWKEFVDLLPDNWECIQLIRMRTDLEIHKQSDWKRDQYEKVKPFSEDLEIDSRFTLIKRNVDTKNAGGGFYLLSRNYVKKVLSVYKKNDKYFFDVMSLNGAKVFPYAELLVIKLAYGACYNFPLFVENIDLKSTYVYSSLDSEPRVYEDNLERYEDVWQKIHVNSNQFYFNFWKENSNLLTIEKMMKII